jgi:hypothetical protein
MLSGARSPQEQALARSLDALGLQVNRDNVLQVRNALKAEFDRLGDLMLFHGPMLHVGECGPDPISIPASFSFNTKVEALANQCRGYVRALGEAANELAETARGYGYTEQHIEASLTPLENGRPGGVSR